MPLTPYLVFGFDVDPANPNAGAIRAAVEANFPITQGVGQLAVDDTFFVEIPDSQKLAIFGNLATYLDAQDVASNGQLRWFVQLVRKGDLAGG